MTRIAAMVRGRGGILVAAGFAIACAAIAVNRAGMMPSMAGSSNQISDEAFNIVEAGLDHMKQFESRPFEDLTLDEIQTVLHGAGVSSWPRNAPTDPEAVLDQAAAFLFHRFVLNDREHYTKWNTDRGMKLRSRQDMNKSWYIEQDWPVLFGEDLPDDMQTPEIMAKLWDRIEGLRPKDEHLRALIVDTAAIGGVTVTHRDDPRPSLDTSSMPSLYWYGRGGGTDRRWWAVKRDRSSLLDRFGRAFVVDVGVVFEYAGGIRQPRIMGFLWDPIEEKWVLDSFRLSSYFADRRGLTVVEY